MARVAWATYLGGSNVDAGYGIAVDGAGNAFVTGDTYSSDFAGANNSFHGGARRRLCGQGHQRRLVGLGDLPGRKRRRMWLRGIAVDGAGNALVTGVTSSTDFAGANNSYHGGDDAFVAKVTSGGSLNWATYLGGSGND